MRVAIIGTAGYAKNTSSQILTRQLFEGMVAAAQTYLLQQHCGSAKLLLSEIDLVSGGAAWSNHVAIRLFLQAYLSVTVRRSSVIIRRSSVTIRRSSVAIRRF